MRRDGVVGHAELRTATASSCSAPPARATRSSNAHASIYVVVEDPDALHDRAKAAGAEISRELQDMDYGSREFAPGIPRATSGASGRTIRSQRTAFSPRCCHNLTFAMTDRPAHQTLHTGPRGAGYTYFSYRTWRFS